jgi:NFU1 iron-sulfur cluster scaffold homolog, mitochondrial
VGVDFFVVVPCPSLTISSPCSPGTAVLESGTATFSKNDDLRRSPLARALLRLDGVTGVFFGKDFITVNREEDSEEWDVIKPEVFATVMDFFASGQPVMTETEQVDGATADEGDESEDSEIVLMIKELLEERIRPHVQADGGDIVFVDFEDGIVYLELQGACSSCPSSSATLHGGVERMLQHYIPEVVGVVQVSLFWSGLV